MSFVSRGLPILLVAVLLLLFLGCSTPGASSSERVIPEEFEFTYSKRISAPTIQISGGNLVWHKKLPSTSYTLEDVAIEAYNFGDFDILVAQLEMRVDENSKLFNIDMIIPAGARSNLVVQPMMEGYHGGSHVVHMTLLDENGSVLYETASQEVGPLEPPSGTVSWEPLQM